MKKTILITVAVILTIAILFAVCYPVVKAATPDLTLEVMLVLLSGYILIQKTDLERLLPYDTILGWEIYDHVHYTGECYHLTSNRPKKGVDGGQFSEDNSENISVIIVDSDCVPYDEDRKEQAQLYTDDPDFLFFDSAYFTKQ